MGWSTRKDFAAAWFCALDRHPPFSGDSDRFPSCTAVLRPTLASAPLHHQGSAGRPAPPAQAPSVCARASNSLPLAVIADRSAGRGWTVLTSGRGRRRMRPARSRLRRSVCGVPRTIGRPSARWRSRSANAGTSPASGPRRGRRAAVRAPPIHRPGHPGGPAPGTRRRSGRPIDFINVQRASNSWMLLRIAGIGSLITTKRNEVRTLPEFRSGS